MKEGNEPMFTMEVFLNTNAHIDELRDSIAKKTGGSTLHFTMMDIIWYLHIK